MGNHAKLDIETVKKYVQKNWKIYYIILQKLVFEMLKYCFMYITGGMFTLCQGQYYKYTL